MKTRTQLLLLLLIIFSAAGYFIADRILEDIKPRFLQSMEESMNDTAHLLALYIENESSWKDGKLSADEIGKLTGFRSALQQLPSRFIYAPIYDMVKYRVDIRVYVTDEKGIVIFDSDHDRDLGKDYSRWNDVFLTLRGRYGVRSSKDDSRFPDISIKYIAAPVKYEGRVAGVLTVGKPSTQLSHFISNAYGKMRLILLITAAAAFFIIILVTFYVTRPIEKLTRYVNRIASGEKPVKPALAASDMKDLAAAFEEMRDRLEGRDYIEKYVQDLTHEMKSPLTSLIAAAEILAEDPPDAEKKRFISNINSESLRLKNMIETLLSLASVERQKNPARSEDIALTGIFSELAAGFSSQLQQKNLKMTVSASDTFIRGERDLLKRAFANLLQNAIDFSPSGGEITVSADSVGESVVVRIHNRGPAIPEFALEKVFERFFSLNRPDGRKGTGLGLAFTAEVLRLHRAEIVPVNEADGVSFLLKFS